MSGPNRILEIDGLVKRFHTRYGVLTAVADVSFHIKKGEIFGLVGESGSGKTTIGSMITGMYKSDEGRIIYKGRDINAPAAHRPKEIKRDIQLVFQDPGSSLNPRMTIREILSLPLRLHHKIKNSRRLEQKVVEVLEKVGLPAGYLDKYPQTIGGGEKQLVCIGRALAPDSSFIVLDEPTSALDVSIQAKITNTLLELQRQYRLSYLFITHNLCLVRNLAHRAAIMYLGKLCEMAPIREFFTEPMHPYTRMLLSSIPVITEEEECYKPARVPSVGEIPNPIDRPRGCGFSTRCPTARDICSEQEPLMQEVKPGHFVSCHMEVA